MRKRTRIAVAAFAIGLTACTADPESNVPKDLNLEPTPTPMKNLLWTVELPTADLKRAITFYQKVLGVSIEEMDMGTTRMGILPSDEGTVGVVLVHGEGYAPSADGTTAYLEIGDDLQRVLDKVVPSGGQVIMPKTEVAPEMGFFALFLDSEGNKVGLHSMQ